MDALLQLKKKIGKAMSAFSFDVSKDVLLQLKK